ncbi:hypothetical protein K2173_007114 [Erythroxylum novogranatense]|uniref:Pectinesterase inhibitor domain-containing protein n=1 Tax=Erythroxylum novogranatense TaxID=1862640 RepID=A0AAV8SYD4_9ROSI|nr:hypothetical protein K2173_007114 [Erythroxylum novogranatense]
MKNLLVFLMFIIPINAALPRKIGGSLIDRTCKQTPYYDVCVKTLLSNPQSYDTDEEGLARIMVSNVEARATQTLNHVNKWLEQPGLESNIRQALISCAHRYNAIVGEDIPQAIKGLNTERYMLAEQASYDVATEAMSCEEDFSNKSPLTYMNMRVHDISIVAASIIKTIKSGEGLANE